MNCKENQQLAKQERLFRWTNPFRVNADGTHDAVRADGSVALRLADGSLDLGEAIVHSIRWEFIVPGLEGQKIDEVLELIYARLSEDVLPTVESYFQPEV